MTRSLAASLGVGMPGRQPAGTKLLSLDDPRAFYSAESDISVTRFSLGTPQFIEAHSSLHPKGTHFGFYTISTMYLIRFFLPAP